MCGTVLKGSTAPSEMAPQARIFTLSCLAALTAVGCGSGSDQATAPPPDYTAALRGAPAPLAALYHRGDRLLGGGTAAYEARLRGLRGHPVVVNDWASWCEPCRREIPLFGRAAARFGTRVAFLGVDGEDNAAAARTFLREHPLPYPSFADPESAISAEQGGPAGYPRTAFYDERGKLVFLKPGPYASLGELAADIRRHTL